MASTASASSSYHLQRWQQFKGRRIGALSRLAKELGYASIRDPEFTRRIQLLTERKEVDIQQSGYVGDSMHHIKLASIDEQAFAALQGLTPATTVQPRQPRHVETKTFPRFNSASIIVKHLTQQSQRIGVDIIGPVVCYGSGAYVRIPKEIVDYYGFVGGDRVEIRLIERKNWRDIDMEDTQGEPISSHA